MKNKFVRFSLMFAFVFICACCANLVFAQNAPDADEYSVYKTVLQERFISKETKEIAVGKKVGGSLQTD